MRFFFLGHLGLGDHYCLTGIVRYWAQGNTEEVKVVCKKPNLATLQALYGAEPKITFYPVDDDREISPHYGADPQVLQKIAAEGYTILAIGTHGRHAHSYLSLDPCWANCFYKELGLDPALRFKLWTGIPKPSQYKAEQLWLSVAHALYNQDYVIIHDDPSRDFVIPYEHVYRSLQTHGLLHLPVLYLGKDRYTHSLAISLNNPLHVAPLLQSDSALHYTVLMRHAKALYMMDSSMAILHDLETPHDLNPSQVRVSYMKYDILPTDTGLYQGQWTYSKVNP
jgi:hypothetical protein